MYTEANINADINFIIDAKQLTILYDSKNDQIIKNGKPLAMLTKKTGKKLIKSGVEKELSLLTL